MDENDEPRTCGKIKVRMHAIFSKLKQRSKHGNDFEPDKQNDKDRILYNNVSRKDCCNNFYLPKNLLRVRINVPAAKICVFFDFNRTILIYLENYLCLLSENLTRVLHQIELDFQKLIRSKM